MKESQRFETDTIEEEDEKNNEAFYSVERILYSKEGYGNINKMAQMINGSYGSSGAMMTKLGDAMRN